MNLLDILNEEVISNQKEILPDWVSENNSSLKAYRKINELKLDKLDYIKRHSKVSDYRKKSNYSISNQDVIDALQMGRSGLFGHNSYAEALKGYLKSTNEELEQKKSSRLKKGGLLAKDKKTVVKKAQSLQQEYDALKNKKLSEFYDDLVNKMPIKDRQKLGIM
jgi:hypothetical protein